MTPWTAACQASLSINSWSLLKLMSIKSVMPSNHLILGRPLLPLPSIFPSIRIFSNESVLCIRWPKYWSFSLHAKPDARVTPRWLKKHPDSCNSKTLCSHILPQTSAVGMWGDLSGGNHCPATASWHLCAAAERPCAKLSSRESKVEDSLKGKTI